MNKLIPVLAVIIGWSLKSLSDYLTRIKLSKQNFGIATYHILKAYKIILDYERIIRNFRSDNPPIDKFEPLRKKYCNLFLSRLKSNETDFRKAIELLASIEPCLATQVDNTLNNIKLLFKIDLQSLIKSNPEGYVAAISKEDYVVDFTLSHLKTVANKLALASSITTRIKLQIWFWKRNRGEKEFSSGIEEVKKILKTDTNNSNE